MFCFRCGSNNLGLAPLSRYHRKLYAEIGWVMRMCGECGLYQNHVGIGEPLTPAEAAEQAPIVKE